MLDNTEGTVKNGKCIENGNIGYTKDYIINLENQNENKENKNKENKNKESKNKTTTHYVLDVTMHKRTYIT